MLGKDGTHYTPAGSDRLAEAVADVVLRQLPIVGYRPLPKPAAGPKAAEEYRQAEAARDPCGVPEVYRNLKAKEFPVPSSADAWNTQRFDLLKAVVGTLGDLPRLPSPSQARVISRELRPGYILEKAALDNGVDGQVTTLLLLPESHKSPMPAILWLPLLTPRQNPNRDPRHQRRRRVARRGLRQSRLRGPRPRLVLARRPRRHRPLGQHGDRQGRAGVAPQVEPLVRPLPLGQRVVRDDQVAARLPLLPPRSGHDPHRRDRPEHGEHLPWWLAAVDDRVAAVVAVACLTRYQNLITTATSEATACTTSPTACSSTATPKASSP